MMCRKPLLTMFLSVFLLLLSIPVLAIEDSPAATAAGFKAAMQNANSELAASYLAENLLIYEQGYVETSRDEYLTGHFNSDAEFMRSTSTEVLNFTLGNDGQTAWLLSKTRTRGQFKGAEVDSRGTESMLLKKTPMGWKIYHIHWSSHRAKPEQ